MSGTQCAVDLFRTLNTYKIKKHGIINKTTSLYATEMDGCAWYESTWSIHETMTEFTSPMMVKTMVLNNNTVNI